MKFCVLSCIAILVSATLREENGQLQRTNEALQLLLQTLDVKLETSVAEDEDPCAEPDPESCLCVTCPSNQNCHKGQCMRDRHGHTETLVGETAVAQKIADWNCYACNDNPDYEYCAVEQGGTKAWSKMKGTCVPKGTCATELYEDCRSFDAEHKSDGGCFMESRFAIEEFADTDLYHCGLKCLANPECDLFGSREKDKKCFIGKGISSLSQKWSTDPWLCGDLHVVYKPYRDPHPEDPGYSRWNCQGCIDDPDHDWCWWNDQGNVQVACAPHIEDDFGLPCTGALDTVLEYCFESHTRITKAGCVVSRDGTKKGERALYWCGDLCKSDPKCTLFTWHEESWQCEHHYNTDRSQVKKSGGLSCVGSGYPEVYQVANYDEKEK